MVMDRSTIVRYISIIVWMFVWVEAAWAQAGLHSEKELTQYSHDIWQTEDGLPQNSISCITQTRDGYLWLGTLEGLVRFDGVRFTVFDAGNTPALLSNRIVSLYEDRLGNLWVGTEGGGVMRLSHGEFTLVSTADGLLSNTVGQICEDREGRIWIAHGNGVSICKGGDIISIGHDDSIASTTPGEVTRSFRKGNVSLVINNYRGLPGKSLGPICSDRSGNIWIGSDSGLLCYDGNKFRLYTKRDGLPNTEFFALYPSGNGALWIGTAHGLVLFQNERFTVWTTKKGLPHEFVWSLCERRDGSLLIGTQGGGLCAFNGKRFTRFSTENGLSNDVVWSLFEDREGILWIGTNGGGLNRLKNAPFTTYTTLQGLAYDFVWSITQAPNGDLWFGTYQGLTRYSKGTFQSFDKGDGLSNDFIWSVYVDRSGTVWVGTANGLNKFVNGKFIQYDARDGLVGHTVRSMLQDREGALWVGTVGGVNRLTSSNPSKFIALTKEDGLSNSIVMSLCEGNDGSLWIGTGGGLNRYKNGNITSFTVMDGLSNDIIRSLYEDAEGTLWIGTQGGGLNLYRNGKFTSITQRRGLFNNVVSQILEDDRGNLWMSCNKGIFRVHKRELLDFADDKISTIVSYPYGKDDGMKSPECNGSSQPAGWKSKDGRLWFPTIKGVVVVNPNQGEINKVAPPVIIENVSVNKKPISEFHPGKIPVESGDLEVEYTGLSFYAPEKVTFRYRLDGYDKEWKDVGTRRTAYYTNLSPGTYTFWVTAVGSDSSFDGPSSSLSFTLLPPFYKELWFYLLVGATVISIVIGGYRLRMKQVQRREQRLIRLVKERTQNLQTEKENSEQARIEAVRLQQLAEEANKVKSEILHIAAHDMKSPLISIKMFSQVIASEAGIPASVGQFADDIYHNTQRMLDLINELLEASAIENGKLILHKTRVDVSRLAESTILTHKKTAERKEQHITVQAEHGCFIEADESRIRQVMDNLISNAIKYSPNGKNIWVAVHSCGEHVRIEVKDEGPGLSLEDLEKVFGKFQRLTPRPTGGEPSTGLGLSVVKQLVELQNGRVWVESDHASGSTFIVEFKSVKMSGVHQRP
ncbi:MAG: sensor histidine kinase [Bacteroidetes bacterium]|nr:MAG: sensor histidine kinase [Bacteroidota bacterium]